MTRNSGEYQILMDLGIRGVAKTFQKISDKSPSFPIWEVPGCLQPFQGSLRPIDDEITKRPACGCVVPAGACVENTGRSNLNPWRLLLKLSELNRSFSAVSTPIFASRYSFCSIFETYKIGIPLHRSQDVDGSIDEDVHEY